MNGIAVVEDGHRPSLRLTSSYKFRDTLTTEDFLPGGALSPDVKPPGFTPQLNQPLNQNQSASVEPLVEKIGNYLLLEKLCTASASTTLIVHRAIHIPTQQEYICKVFPLNKYRELLAPHWESGYHDHINNILEIIVGPTKAYVLFQRCHEDLHSYIRRKRRLKEVEAAALFSQILRAIQHCHERGVVLRDLKLRKFIFIDEQRTHLVLDGLEDACLLDDIGDDMLTDKHGCPAYVSPEILTAAASPTSTGYCGKPADMWSVGVILYTMLFGQYPFHDTVASQLFGKIRRGRYQVPDSVTATARCLVRSLLRTEPSERLTVEATLQHPWFTSMVRRTREGSCVNPSVIRGSNNNNNNNPSMVVKSSEQLVPQWQDEESSINNTCSEFLS